MLVEISATLAYELAGVADATANASAGRPALENVQIELSENPSPEASIALRAVATDSYMLGLRELSLPAANIYDFEHKDVLLKTPLQVHGKAWKKALKDAAAEKGPDGILIDFAPEAITIARKISKSPEVRVPTTTEYSFPQYRKLIGEPLAEGEFSLPAWNPVYMGRVQQIVSAKPADRSVFPVKVRATGANGDAAMRPWLFVSDHTEKNLRSHLEVLLMPVRV